MLTKGTTVNHHPPSSWEVLRSIGDFLGGIGGAAVLAFGTIKLLPIIMNRPLLVTRLHSAETAAREYRAACEEQHKSIILLEARNEALQKRINLQEREALDFTVAAGTFILTLTKGLKRLTDLLSEAGLTALDPLPPIPYELERAVLLAHKKQLEQRAQEVPHADRPF